MRMAVMALTRGGKGLAEAIQRAYPPGQVRVYLPARRFSPGPPPGLETGGYRVTTYYERPFGEQLGALFSRYRALVCIMSAGIVVRALAPYLKNKEEDPAVVVADEKGKHYISLLSGHLGGANRLAEELARRMGGGAVITTATDTCGKPALEMLALRWDMAAVPGEHIKVVNAALVNGSRVRVLVEKGLHMPPGFPLGYRVEDLGGGRWQAPMPDYYLPGEGSGRPGGAGGRRPGVPVVIVTSRALVTRRDRAPGQGLSGNMAGGGAPVLCLHPRDIVLGCGCKRGVNSRDIIHFIGQSFQEEGYSLHSLRKIVTLEIKRDEQGLGEAAQELGVPLEFVSLEEIKGLEESGAGLSQSEFVRQAIGVGGACEPAALLGAGSRTGRGELLWKKKKGPGITTAAARVISRWWV